MISKNLVLLCYFMLLHTRFWRTHKFLGASFRAVFRPRCTWTACSGAHRGPERNHSPCSSETRHKSPEVGDPVGKDWRFGRWKIHKNNHGVRAVKALEVRFVVSPKWSHVHYGSSTSWKELFHPNPSARRKFLSRTGGTDANPHHPPKAGGWTVRVKLAHRNSANKVCLASFWWVQLAIVPKVWLYQGIGM